MLLGAASAPPVLDTGWELIAAVLKGSSTPVLPSGRTSAACRLMGIGNTVGVPMVTTGVAPLVSCTGLAWPSRLVIRRAAAAGAMLGTVMVIGAASTRLPPVT